MPEQKGTGSLLARNTAWNAAGLVLPVGVALIAIPVLVRALGADRFGVLALAWMVVGYLGFLDLGLGRALTKLIAENLGGGTTERLPALVWTGLVILGGLGVLGAIVAAVATPSLVGWILSVPPGLQVETREAFWLLSVSVPFVVVTAGLRGVLEAYQRFDLVNALRIPLGVFNFVGPAVTAQWTDRIDVIVAVLVAGRIVATFGHLVLCRAAAPAMAGSPVLDASQVGPLLRQGGWMTVTNVVGPVMVYFDRFIIGGQVSMSAVAFYVTPYEVVTKLLVVPAALVGVLFPEFSRAFASDPGRAARLLGAGVKLVFVMLFPAALVAVTLGHEGLEFWLGPEFADQGTPVLRWLAAGVFLNGLAQIPFTFLQGAGRPDLTAKLHLVELPLYLGALWWAVQRHGIVGAAAVWTARVALDGAVIFWMARGLLPGTEFLLRTGIAVAGALVVLMVGSLLPGAGWRAALAASGLVASVPVAWRLARGVRGGRSRAPHPAPDL